MLLLRLSLACLLALLATGCCTFYSVGAITHPWGEFEAATSGWVVLDEAGTPQRVVVVTESREHVNPNIPIVGPGLTVPEGRTGLARVTFEPPDGSGGALEVVDYDVPPGFESRARFYASGGAAGPEARDRFKNDAPRGGVAVTFLEPGIFEWEGKRYSLAPRAPRSWTASIGWASLIPVAIVADVVLIPFYVGFGIALLAAS